MNIETAEGQIRALEICQVREEVGSREYEYLQEKINKIKRDIARTKNAAQKQITDFNQRRL